MNYAMKIEKEISFMLYNYKKIDKLIENRRNTIIDSINSGMDSWSKSKTQIIGYTLEETVIKLDEDNVINRLKKWKKLLDEFFLSLYTDDDYVLSSFCKLKYLEKKDDYDLKILLDLNKEEINYLDSRIKSNLFDKAFQLHLYSRKEEKKYVAM